MAAKTKTDVLLEICSLVEWAGPGFCGTCNYNLGQQFRRWCSEECEKWFVENHRWGMAREVALRRDRRCCRVCGSKRLLEVNHMIPVLGNHGDYSCRHHVEGLQTLCHNCHTRVTNQQRHDGKLRR